MSVRQSETRARHGRNARAAARKSSSGAPSPALASGVTGGFYRPLSPDVLAQTYALALRLMEETGFSEASDDMIERVIAAGGRLSSDKRLRFPTDLVEKCLGALPRGFTLCGQTPAHDLALAIGRVHAGSGGAAPLVFDLDDRKYRPSTLKDLYDAARLVDALEHIRFFSRSMVARDIQDTRSLDINTTYACLCGTSKHVMVSASETASVTAIADMCWRIAGGRDAFEARPFLSLNVNHATPPMRMSEAATDVMAEASRLGIPVHANVFSQVGASAPVRLTEAIAQATAEALAGMVYAWLVNPDAKLTFGPRPMIVDLRTGAMSGGSGEQAVAMAAAAQIGNYLQLANSSIAGASDSKLADAQAGFEKAISITLAAQAGSNLITQAAGMQAGLMGCAPESYLIDNDMLGVVMSGLRGAGMPTKEAAKEIDRVVRGDGHFLGEPSTLASVEKGFVYPAISDRQPIEAWEEAGALDIADVARTRTRKILRQHYPNHIGFALDAELRDAFDIRLPRALMAGEGDGE